MKNLLLTILLSAAVACGIGIVIGNAKSPHASPTATESVYDRVIKSGKIRCGYTIVRPSLSRDPNTGELSGISYDIVNQLGKDLGLKVEWVEETTFATMSEALNADRFDMVCTVIWSSTHRGKASGFTIPLYYSAINAYARGDDKRFDNIRTFNKPELTIATVDGSTAAAIARDDAPLAKTYALPDLTDFSEVLVALRDKKADITFTEASQAAVFLENNPGVVKNVTPNQPVRLYANRLSMKMGEDNLAHMIDNGLQNLLNSGFVDQVLDKYAAPNAYRRVAKPYR
ncbi:MAG: substrate-binding periplasmic protein [Bdellovibrionales bacterium]